MPFFPPTSMQTAHVDRLRKGKSGFHLVKPIFCKDVSLFPKYACQEGDCEFLPAWGRPYQQVGEEHHKEQDTVMGGTRPPSRAARDADATRTRP